MIFGKQCDTNVKLHPTSDLQVERESDILLKIMQFTENNKNNKKNNSRLVFRRRITSQK